jgi:hypothetical protein
LRRDAVKVPATIAKGSGRKPEKGAGILGRKSALQENLYQTVVLIDPISSLPLPLYVSNAKSY